MAAARAAEATGPIRVLHQLGKLDPGGIETWLLNLVRLEPGGIRFDFVVEKPGGKYEAEIRGHGCSVHHLEYRSRLKKRIEILGLARRSRSLDRILVENSYDAFHVHGEEFMGDAVKVASEVGVPVRVVHCHSTVLARGQRNLEMALRAARFRTLDRRRILRYATDICAVSDDAGRFLMGSFWRKDPRCRRLYCGVPLDRFREVAGTWDPVGYRASRGIPRDSIVVGHVGSMGPSPVKNHLFLLEVFDILSRRDKRFNLYLAGDGPLRPVIERNVRLRGLEERVFMPGVCDDVPALMAGGFDVHLLPSLHEGLPIVGLEAIAAGLYTVCSDSITSDFTGRFQDRLTAVSLNASPAHWADQVQAGVEKRISPVEGTAIIENSPFSIRASLDALIGLYRAGLAERPRPQC